MKLFLKLFALAYACDRIEYFHVISVITKIWWSTDPFWIHKISLCANLNFYSHSVTWSRYSLSVEFASLFLLVTSQIQRANNQLIFKFFMSRNRNFRTTGGKSVSLSELLLRFSMNKPIELAYSDPLSMKIQNSIRFYS